LHICIFAYLQILPCTLIFRYRPKKAPFWWQARTKTVILPLKYKQMKRLFTLIGLLACLGGFAQVRISQVYGGGSNASATYNQDFVELFNAGGSAVTIGGWSVQYASATGTAWAVSAIPAGASLAPGQYFLMAMSTAGATGIALPAPDATGGSNMSGTAGKVALVNNTTALSGATACSNAAVVDVLGYGSTATCFETAFFATTGITNAQSIQRGSNGCTDAGNNSTDFAIGTVNPRNTTSTPNSCGGPTPFIAAGPNIANITSSFGTASASQSYNLSASNLTPASGNITITPSTGLEISTDNVSFGAAPINVAYSSGGISPATPIYVRLAASAAQGAFSGSITHTGGGAPTATLTVNGGVFQNYYNTKANTGLTNTGTWSTTTDGTGPSPANFTDGYQLFNIINQTNANYTGVWNVTATGNTSRVVVGNGTAPLTFTILAGADSLTGATRVDVLNNGTLVLLNNRRPFLNNLATGSTVSFAQTGTTTADTIRIPTLSFFNLTLKDGIKLLSGNTTTVRGDFTVDNVLNFNGPKATPFATLNTFGDLYFVNGTTFEPQPAGDAGRITLAMNNNTGGPQNIFGNGVELMLFRLRRDTTSQDNDIVLAPGTNLTLGNAAGGGLQLAQGAATTTTLTMGNSTLKLIGAATVSNTSLGQLFTSNSNITIQKSAGTTNAGTLRFTPTSTLNQLTMDFDPAYTRDSILVADNVKVTGTLNLTKGKVVMAAGKMLTLDVAAIFTGGSNTSFVDGKLGRNTASASTFVLPVGKASTYRPLSLTPASAATSAYTAEYFPTAYSSLTVSAPLTGVSNVEYWDMAKLSGVSAEIALSLNGTAVPGATAADEVGVARYNGSSWVIETAYGLSPGDVTTGTARSAYLDSLGAVTFGISGAATTYTFNGNGNWSDATNWQGGVVPPATLTAPNRIIINHVPGGTCNLNSIVGGQQVINSGARFIVYPFTNLLLPGNLVIQ
jgi:hypothetical protein